MTNSLFSTSYELLTDGRLRFCVATIEEGQVFVMDLDPEEAINNVVAFARTLGLVISRPLDEPAADGEDVEAFVRQSGLVVSRPL